MNDDDNNIDPKMALSFGKRFSTARGALNLSREDVAKELRLSVNIISALENEDYEQLTVPIYVTGYIRNYARLLKIPVEPLLAAYNQVQLESPTIVAAAMRKSKPSYSHLLIKIASTFIVLVLLAGLFSWFQSQNFEPSTWFSSQSEPENTGPLILLPELAEPDKLPPKSDITAEDKSPVVIENIPEVAPRPNIEPEPEPVMVVEAPPVAVEKPINVAEKEIVLTLTTDSWVDLKDSSGKRLIYDLLRAGKVRRVSGLPPFRVYLGNAKGVKIEYNGELIDIEQHTRGNLARFRIGAVGD